MKELAIDASKLEKSYNNKGIEYTTAESFLCEDCWMLILLFNVWQRTHKKSEILLCWQEYLSAD